MLIHRACQIVELTRTTISLTISVNLTTATVWCVTVVPHTLLYGWPPLHPTL